MEMLHERGEDLTQKGLHVSEQTELSSVLLKDGLLKKSVKIYLPDHIFERNYFLLFSTKKKKKPYFTSELHGNFKLYAFFYPT